LLPDLNNNQIATAASGRAQQEARALLLCDLRFNRARSKGVSANVGAWCGVVDVWTC
jgi:hypothetical protein